MNTVLITGGSRGIGAATALEFGKHGFNVALNYKNSIDSARFVQEKVTGNGGVCELFCGDIAMDSEKIVGAVIEKFGTIDVLVNNAGIALPQGLFTDFSEKEQKGVFDVNVFGMMNCTRAVIPEFVRKKSGSVVNVSSVWGISGGSCEVIYSASKGAVIAFSKALAKELAPSGIRVNCVAPGFIETDMNSHLTEEEKLSFVQEIPLGRTGTPEDVAKCIYFLSSDDAKYITGQTITIDGGM